MPDGYIDNAASAYAAMLDRPHQFIADDYLRLQNHLDSLENALADALEGDSPNPDLTWQIRREINIDRHKLREMKENTRRITPS